MPISVEPFFRGNTLSGGLYPGMIISEDVISRVLSDDVSFGSFDLIPRSELQVLIIIVLWYRKRRGQLTLSL